MNLIFRPLMPPSALSLLKYAPIVLRARENAEAGPLPGVMSPAPGPRFFSARAASGQITAVPPRSEMNSRRLICRLRAQDHKDAMKRTLMKIRYADSAISFWLLFNWCARLTPYRTVTRLNGVSRANPITDTYPSDRGGRPG